MKSFDLCCEKETLNNINTVEDNFLYIFFVISYKLVE